MSVLRMYSMFVFCLGMDCVGLDWTGLVDEIREGLLYSYICSLARNRNFGCRYGPLDLRISTMTGEFRSVPLAPGFPNSFPQDLPI